MRKMNKIKSFMVFMCLLLSSMGEVEAQERINQFVVEIDEAHNPMTIYSSYGATPNDGVVIVNSTIPDLEFNIPTAPGRIKTIADKKKNRYVLIIQPNDNNYRQYTITINAKGFVQGKIGPVEVRAGLSTGYIVNPKRKIYNAFVSCNYSYGIGTKAHSVGVSCGKLLFYRNKLGLFLSGSKNLTPVTANGECDKEGYLADGSRPQYVNYLITSQWTVLGGVYWRLESFYLKGGMGIGARNVYWQTKEDYYYRNLGFSRIGLALTGGIQYHINQIVLSLDVVTNGFRTTDIKIGLGYSF